MNCLKAIHDCGFIHRDLKPDNFFFGLDGNIKIGDLDYVTNEKFSKQQCGTPGYASPELAKGSWYNNKTDIFSLGVFFNFLINNELIYNSADFQENY